MSASYHRLSSEERASIMIQHGQGATISAIARLLGRHRSTISRELSRQTGGPYSPVRAAERYRQARRRCERPKKSLGGLTPPAQYAKQLAQQAGNLPSDSRAECY